MNKNERGSVEAVQAMMQNRARLEANSLLRGQGGIVNILRAAGDTRDVEQVLDSMAQQLNIQPDDIVYIDVEAIVTKLEYGIRTYDLGISEETLDKQSLAENIFQIAYQGFGQDGTGWRIGRPAMLDHLREAVEKGEADLSDSAFADFLASLNLQDLGQEEPHEHARKLVVLDFPSLTNATQKEIERAETFLHIFSLLTQAYPNRFQKDNPHKHMVVTLTDNSYRWQQSTRDMRWEDARDFINNKSMVAPVAYFEDEEMLKKKKW